MCLGNETFVVLEYEFMATHTREPFAVPAGTISFLDFDSFVDGISAECVQLESDEVIKSSRN